MLKLLRVAFEVFGNTGSISLHAFIAAVPACGADFAVLFVELQRVDHADGFIDIAAQRQVG